MIVVDASLMVEALTNDDALGHHSRAVLADDAHWISPDHFKVEVTSAIRGRMLGKKISEERADAAIGTLNRLRISTAPWTEVVAEGRLFGRPQSEVLAGPAPLGQVEDFLAGIDADRARNWGASSCVASC